MSRAVILLKSPSHDLAEDAYFQQFSSSGYDAHFVEVLASTFINGKQLADIIREGAIGYQGVVVTSKRAAEAWIHALTSLDVPGDWGHIPFYVVGEATARTLRYITTLYPNYFSEALIIGATQAGRSELLATFVLADLPQRKSCGKLLYLTGDKNTDTFNRMMNEGGIKIESLCVYGTMATHNLEENINNVIKEIQKETSDFSPWIVFFAPSSSDFALPHLNRHFQLYSAGNSGGTRARLAAIGPTTADFLREQRLEVDVIASQPTPDHLVQAIRDADRKPPS